MTTDCTTTSMPLVASKLNGALAAIERHWMDSQCASVKASLDASDFAGLKTMADLMDKYDFGEPAWNGTLNLLAKHLVAAHPHRVDVSSLENISKIETDAVGCHFHHGDVHVSGDFFAYDSVWITGNLIVAGVIDASHLDAYQDLMVGGNIICEAIQFMGLSMIGGFLEVRRFASVHSQGHNLVLGGVRGPCLLGDAGSTSDWDSSMLTHHVDQDDTESDELATLLGVSPALDDEAPYQVAIRALDNARHVL